MAEVWPQRTPCVLSQPGGVVSAVPSRGGGSGLRVEPWRRAVADRGCAAHPRGVPRAIRRARSVAVPWGPCSGSMDPALHHCNGRHLLTGTCQTDSIAFNTLRAPGNNSIPSHLQKQYVTQSSLWIQKNRGLCSATICTGPALWNTHWQGELCRGTCASAPGSVRPGVFAMAAGVSAGV